MADSGAEREEEPTAKRREKFREDGKVAMSRDVSGVAVTTAGFGVLVFTGPKLVRDITDFFRRSWMALAETPREDLALLLERELHHATWTFIGLFFPVALTCLLVGVVIGLAQTGLNWSSKAIGFKWDRLQFLSGFKRVLGSIDSLVQVGLSLLKAAVLGAALFLILRADLPDIIELARAPLFHALRAVGLLLVKLLVTSLIASAFIAWADYKFTKWRMEKQMKMTKQEVKDEHKQSEGDPQVKARLRQRMREIGRNRMLAETRDADVVVVNPTHYAVALSYKLGQQGAPKLLAKGKDRLALKIREIARKHQIPIVSNPPVARAVFASTKVGREVPPELYEMVARVIAYLYRLRQGARPHV